MKITNIEALPFRIPFYPELSLKFAYRTSASADHVLIRVHTDEGLTGISEAPARPQIYGETQESIIAVVQNLLASSLSEMDPFDLVTIHAALDRIPFNFCAKAAIDIALHDLIGKYLNVPIYKLLGGKHTDAIPLSWMVGIKSKEDMVSECVKFTKDGFKAFKLKAGLDMSEDVRTFAAIRESVGDDVNLYADANMGFKSLHKAIETVNALYKYNLSLIEEPLPLENWRNRRDFARNIPVPVLGDESCKTPADVRREIELGTVGIVLIKIARTGFYKSREIIALCKNANIPVMIGSQGDSSIGAVSSAHMYVSAGNIMAPAEVSYHLRMKGDLLSNTPALENGFLELPEGPGLGCAIDERSLEELRI